MEITGVKSSSRGASMINMKSCLEIQRIYSYSGVLFGCVYNKNQGHRACDSNAGPRKCITEFLTF